MRARVWRYVYPRFSTMLRFVLTVCYRYKQFRA